MNQSGSYSVAKKNQGNADNQYHLLPESSRNGASVTTKSITRTGKNRKLFGAIITSLMIWKNLKLAFTTRRFSVKKVKFNYFGLVDMSQKT